MIKKNGQLRYQHIRKQKMTPTQIPQGGWGPGSIEPTQTCFFYYYYSVTMLQQRMLFGPCYLGSKGLQHAKEIGLAIRGKPPGSFGCSKKLISGRVSFSFLMGLLKTSKHMSVKDAQKHFGSVFGQHAKIYKKI